jgi:hypothetical protein
LTDFDAPPVNAVTFARTYRLSVEFVTVVRCDPVDVVVNVARSVYVPPDALECWTLIVTDVTVVACVT